MPCGVVRPVLTIDVAALLDRTRNHIELICLYKNEAYYM